MTSAWRRWRFNRRMRSVGRPPVTDVEWAILREFMDSDPLARAKRGEL